MTCTVDYASILSCRPQLAAGAPGRLRRPDQARWAALPMTAI